MGSESPDVVLYDVNGVAIAVSNGSAIPAGTSALLVAGSDGTNSRYILVDGSGRQIMVGAAASGAVLAGNPILIGGSDGTDARAILTDTSGRQVVVGAGTAGTPAGGVITIQGVSGGTVVPISGTVTANQGTANTLANAWTTELTDGTNGPVAVKAASTAPVAADKSLVVVVSPNQSAIPVTLTSSAVATTGISIGMTPSTGNVAKTPTRMRSATYNEQTTNFTGSIKSSSASDASAGIGARTVLITYYDQTGAGPNTETVTLNGITAVNLINANHCFIEKMEVATVGTNTTNVGTITLFTGAAGAGTAVCVIGVGTVLGNSFGDMRTFLGHHYTPVSKTSSLATVEVGTSGAQNGVCYLTTTSPLVANSSELPISDYIAVGLNTSGVPRQLLYPIKVSGFARITVWVVPGGNNTQFYGGFDFSDQ